MQACARPLDAYAIKWFGHRKNLMIANISDLTGLEFATNLQGLMLVNNSISDLTPLSDLTNLQTLWLQNNSISDLAPLVANTGLGSGDDVNVKDNPLSTTSINTHIPALQDRGVKVRF